MKIMYYIKMMAKYLLNLMNKIFKVMEGPIKQLYEKDGAEFKPIRACDCDENGNGGGGSLPDTISAQASAYESKEVEAEASVDSKTGVFTFKFGIPAGEKGEPGKDGQTPITYRNVTVFKSSVTKPEKPIGGVWDTVTDTIIYPNGWQPVNNLRNNVWMSIGEFNSAEPDKPVWRDPIKISGEDGVDGVDGLNIEFIYKLTEANVVLTKAPVSVNETGYVPDEWTGEPSGITEELQLEWVCTRKKDEQGNWGEWSIPAIWSKWGKDGKDGNGVEYIYTRNTGGAVPNPTPQDITTDEYQGKGEYEGTEYVPIHLGWTDEPFGVTAELTHEWVSVRKQKDGVWGAFSNPSLWAKYSEDGANGDDGLSIRVMYAKTSGSDDVPPFTTDDINPGSIWTASIPKRDTNTEAIWSISAYFTKDNKLVTSTIINDEGEEITVGWQGPVLMTGVAGVDGVPVNYKTYVYKLSDTQPPKPTSDDPNNPGDGWVDYPVGEGQWWQCIGTVDGNTDLIVKLESGELLWSEVLPVNGRNGIDGGKRVEFRFAVSDGEVIPNLVVTDRYPEGWYTSSPTKADNQHLWMTNATINEDDTLYTNWSAPVKITGERGPRGYTGPAGPAGPMGPSGISGIPGVSIKAKYCLGTKDEYIGGYNDEIANMVDPVAHGWTSTIPKVTEAYQYIWCIQTSIIYERDENNNLVEKLQNPWSEPFKLNGIDGLDAKGIGISKVEEYYLVSELETGVTINTEGWVKNSIPPYIDNKIYLWNYEVIVYEDGSRATPTPPAIIGTKGKDGRGIESITEKYAASDNYTEHPALDSNKWQTTSPATTQEEPFLWNWEHILYTDGTYDDYFAVIGSRGINGDSQIIYPAGVYDNTKSYTATNKKAPYVYDAKYGQYYVLNIKDFTWKGISQNNQTPGDSYKANGGKYWMLMESYDAIFANIGIIANGLIGSSVFNGEFMFSQQGINKAGNPSTNYENFCDSYAESYNGSRDPYNINNSFRPNWCVNFATGEQWLSAGQVYFGIGGSGYLKGDLVADVFTPLLFTEDEDRAFILSKIPADAGKTFTIPYIHASRTAIQFTFTAENSTDKIIYTDREGTSTVKTGTLKITPSDTYNDVGGIGYIDCYGVGTKWHLIERSVRVPTIKFVNSLPSEGVEGILYVLI